MFLHLLYFFHRNACKQKVLTLIRRHILRHLNWVFKVYICQEKTGFRSKKFKYVAVLGNINRFTSLIMYSQMTDLCNRRNGIFVKHI